jgi:alanine-glyoxylate transaminase/serine-glyoxylate transaminase/serine-pyruvate transaminase
MGYWSGARGYHHTASSNLYCALHEAARLALAEGLEARWERHARLGALLAEGLAALGLEVGVAPAHRLPQLTVVRIPEGVDDLAVRRALLERFGIEVGGGLGESKGRVWRIGLMGSGASARNVALVLAALRDVLGR